MDWQVHIARIWRATAMAAIAYTLLLLLIYVFQDKFIFFPQRITHEQWRAIAEEHAAEAIAIETDDGIVLRGWLLPGAGDAPHPTIVFFGGNAMRLDRFAGMLGMLRQRGNSILLVDYRGYGASEGRPSADAIQRDSITVYDAAAAHESTDPQRTYVWGVSIGTAAAAHAASLRPVAGVILVAPLTSTLDVAREAYPFWLPVAPLLRHKLHVLSLAPHITAPAIIIGGAEDRITGPAHAQAVAAAWAGEHELMIIENRGHNDLLNEQRTWESIAAFLERDLQ